MNVNKIEQAMEKSMEKFSDDVIADFKDVVADAEELLKATANQGGEKLAELRAKANESIRVAKARMAGAQAVLIVNTKAAAKATDNYVHEHPWKAVGVGVGFGLVIGLLIGRR